MSLPNTLQPDLSGESLSEGSVHSKEQESLSPDELRSRDEQAAAVRIAKGKERQAEEDRQTGPLPDPEMEIASLEESPISPKEAAHTFLVENGMDGEEASRLLKGRKLKKYFKNLEKSGEPFDPTKAPASLQKHFNRLQTRNSTVQKDALIDQEQAETSQEQAETTQEQAETSQEEQTSKICTDAFGKAKGNSQNLREQYAFVIRELSTDSENRNTLSEKSKEQVQQIRADLQNLLDATDLSQVAGVSETDQVAVDSVLKEVNIDFSSPNGFDNSLNIVAQKIEESGDISDVAKEHLLTKLGRPTIVRNGTEVDQLLTQTVIDPKTGKESPRYSEDNPVAIQGGMEMYTDKNGDQYIKGQGGKPPLLLRANGVAETHDFKQTVKLALMQDVLNDTLDGNSQILLGGEIVGKDAENLPQMLANADTLIRALIPSSGYDPTRIPTPTELGYMRRGLDAMTQNKHMSPDEWKKDFQSLGIISEPGVIKKEALSGLGRHLKNNDYLDAQSAQYKGDNAYASLLDYSQSQGWAEKPQKEPLLKRMFGRKERMA